MKFLQKNKNKVLLSDIEQGLIINGNRYYIKMIISILIDNAIKYASDNSDIKVNSSSYKKKGILTVVNKCDSIDKSEIKNVFLRFYRDDKSIVKEASGME